MTITTPPELLAADTRAAEQRRKFCAPAAQILQRYGEAIAPHNRGEVFAFAVTMLMKASQVQTDWQDRGPEDAEAPQPLVETIARFAPTRRDEEVDAACQSLLSNMSDLPVIPEMVDFERHGTTHMNFLSIYPIQLANRSFDVVRLHPLNEDNSFISYTIQRVASGDNFEN